MFTKGNAMIITFKALKCQPTKIGYMRTGPKENSSLLKNILGKFVRKLSDRIVSQNNDQCRHFIAAVDSKPMSLSWMR